MVSSSFQVLLYYLNKKYKSRFKDYTIPIVFIIIYLVIFYSLFGNPPPRDCQMPMLTVIVFWSFGIIAALIAHGFWRVYKEIISNTKQN